MTDIQTIPMVRDMPVHPGGPVAADVHPDEVAHWRAHGWREAGDLAAAEPANSVSPGTDADVTKNVTEKNPPPAAPGTVDPAAAPGDTAEPAAPAGGSTKPKAARKTKP
jgi:hypothetical protein